MKKSSLQLFKHQQSGSALTGLTNWTFVYWTGESENNHFEWAARDHLVQFSVPLPSRYSRLYHYHSVTILLIWIIMQALPQSPFFHCRHFLSCHNRITTSVTDNIYTGCTPLDLFPVQGKVIHNTAGAIVRHFNDTWAFPVMTHYIQQLCRVQHDVFRLLILSNQQSKTLNVHNPYRAQSCLTPRGQLVWWVWARAWLYFMSTEKKITILHVCPSWERMDRHAGSSVAPPEVYSIFFSSPC